MIWDTANGIIENVIAQAQDNVQGKTKVKDDIWGRITETVNVIIAAVATGKIEEYQINQIVNAILDYALPESHEKSRSKLDLQDKSNTNVATQPSNQGEPAIWASITAKNRQKTTRSPTKLFSA